MAIVQTIATMKGGNTWAAVLDLKAAYDSVPRDKLIHMCDKKLPPNMVAMITHLLQPLTVTKRKLYGYLGGYKET